MWRAFLHSPRVLRFSQFLALVIISLVLGPSFVVGQTRNYTNNDTAEIPFAILTGQWDLLRSNDQRNTTLRSSNARSAAFTIYFRGDADVRYVHVYLLTQLRIL